MRFPARLLPVLLASLSFVTLTRLCAQPYGVPDSSEFRVRNLESVNTPGDDYAPFVVPNGQWLYLTRNHEKSANLYRSHREGDDWGQPEPLTEFNTPLDEGSFSAATIRHSLLFGLADSDMARLNYPHEGIITTSDRIENMGDADLELVELSANGQDMLRSRKIHEVNTGDWDAQGTIAPDGTYIIFASNRSGGMGGMDLYIAYRSADGSFGSPINMGPTINTDGNEFSPFLGPDGRTLFMASNGWKGFGGSDIFISHRDASGTWSTPINLGGRVNTSANELFFFGVDRDRCYFTSDRPGGKGGLDIYEGGPNVFVSGYASLHVTLLDTTTGRRIPGHVSVRETQLGRSVGDRDVVTASGADFLLLDGLAYAIEGASPGYETATASLDNVAPESRSTITLKFGSAPAAATLETPPPVEIAPPVAPEPPMPPMPIIYTFNVDGKVVPFFVSGYYRLNTRPSLAELRRRQAGDLKTQTYITDVKSDRSVFDQNQKVATEVEKLLGDFVELCETTYFPGFIEYNKRKAATDPKEYIQLTVYGFADPRPIIGAYSEDPVTFLDSAGNEVTVRSWERLDNFKLAGLRAYYSVEYFDKLFRRGRARKEYQMLMQQGMIRWRAVSGSVDDLNALTSGEDLGTKRRIVVDARLVDASGKPVQQ